MTDYQEYENKRNRCINKITEHVKNGGSAIIAAGPGTGKTYLFKEIVEKFPLSFGKKVLVLSFINALVDNLEKEFYENKAVEVKTLHSFAKKILGDSIPATEPKLTKIIAEDFLIHRGLEFKGIKIKDKVVRCIENLFHTMKIDLQENAEIKKFYEERKKFYNRASFNDIVYSLVSCLKNDPSQIPTEYDLLIIDEFQDFCNLEAELVELLSQKTGATVIAGDDDQIVYDKATPELLRQKYSSPNTKHKEFTLPFCSRSTERIVDFVNGIVENAKSAGKLQGRICKEYKYFKSKEKDPISKQYSEIIQYELEDRQIPTRIHFKIQGICIDQKPGDETFMVIAPTKSKIKKIKDELAKLGYKNVSVREGKEYDDLTHGMGILLNANMGYDNFGWRLVIGHEDSETLEKVVKESIDNPSKNIVDLCPDPKRKVVKEVLTLLRKLVKTKKPCVREGKSTSQEDKSFTDEEISKLISFLKIDLEVDHLNKLMKDLQVVKEIVKDGNNQQNLFPDAKITLTTPQSAKGLSAGHVFITDCKKEMMFRKESDREVCTLLVAVSRAEKSLTIFTKENSLPSILHFPPDIYA